MADSIVKKKRPVFYNLSPLNLPLPGLVSIFHRVSGAALFIALYWILCVLDTSLASQKDFEATRVWLNQPLMKLIVLGLAWSYLHHFCAGIRFLLLDVHTGIDLPTARKSSGAVFVVSLALTLMVAAKLW
jgi:succinate dehydrogenase / fumarate reductase, cytochrome b subunit